MSTMAPEATPGAAPEPPAQPTPEPPAATPPAASEPAPTADPPANGQEPQGPSEPSSVEQLPSWAQKLIRDTRTEAAANRAKAKEHGDELTALKDKSQQQLDGIAKALGLKPEEATPEQIMAERDAEKARATDMAHRARQADVKLAVLQHATAAQADGNALLDSVAFLRTVENLDPNGDDFTDRVRDAITSATEANPRYNLNAGPPAPPPPPVAQIPASGPGQQQFTSPPPGPRQWTDEDVARAGPKELTAAMEAGLLENLGFGKTKRKQR